LYGFTDLFEKDKERWCVLYLDCINAEKQLDVLFLLQRTKDSWIQKILMICWNIIGKSAEIRGQAWFVSSVVVWRCT